jgi:hypothetical protein
MNPVEQYLKDLEGIRAGGHATEELSYYPPLLDLLNQPAASCAPTRCWRRSRSRAGWRRCC